MQHIYLMRHGESLVNIEHRLTCRKLEGDLTLRGQEQAVQASQWLADKKIWNIIHSPFHRAAQTAHIISQRLNLSITPHDGLREMDCGDLEGHTNPESWQIWQSVYDRWLQRDWNAVFPGGESFQQAFDRFNLCLQSLESNENVLLVTHGGVTNAVVPYLCVNAAALQGNRVLNHTGMVILEPYGDGRYICRAWNQKEHLSGVAC